MKKVSIVAIAVVALLGLIKVAAPKRQFDPIAWSHAFVDHPARYELADDLVGRETLIGLNRPQAEALLGKSTRPDRWLPDWQLTYHLGAERGWFPVDDEWLVMRFDANGLLVTEACVITD